MAQLVERPTLDFGSGYDLMVREFKPRVRLQTDSVEIGWDSFSPSLSLPLSLSLSLFLSQKKETNFKKIICEISTIPQFTHKKTKSQELPATGPKSQR